ncbi:hypothetical protein M3Y99_01282500 [Aphelenchoides fujianensis]|nr:hypothetical protein M3Y99_01282500 [Aphelenchoides fujianensis]
MQATCVHIDGEFGDRVKSGGSGKDPLRFLYYTGLLYDGKAAGLWMQFFRLGRSFAFSFAAILLFLVILVHTVKHSKYTMKHASYHLALDWHLQACFNILLIHYWQRGDWMQQLSIVFNSPLTSRTVRRMGLCLMPLGGLIVVFLVSIRIARHFDNEHSAIFSYDHVFDCLPLAFFARIISWYTCSVYLLLNFYFIASTSIVFNELRDFNRRFAAKLLGGNLHAQDKTEVASTLHSFYLDHLFISNKVRALDRAWSVFTFSTAVTTIPALVFGLWTFISRLESNWMHISLTATRIREEIRETRSLLFSSLPLWEHFEARTAHVGQLFAAHLDQDDLGVSIWQFVMLSKQFVFSIVSITITLLVFLLETHNGTKSLVAHRTMGKFS